MQDGDYIISTVTARAKTWVCGRSLAGITGSNPSGGMLSGRGLCDGRSLVQRSPTECGVSECESRNFSNEET